MSPIAMMLDLMLAGLLILTLAFGMRLERNLKALRKSQADFVGAVSDLDQAATRAEAGLAELKGAVDDAALLLGSRIEKGRELAGKLETLSAAASTRHAEAAAAAKAAASITAAVRSAPAPTARAPIDRLPVDRTPLTLTREQALPAQRRPAPPQRPSLRSRALVDDELFEGPAQRPGSRAGARL
jgi:hypothetical protein